MREYLNECPICGGKAELSMAEGDTDAYYGECPACEKSTDEFLTEEEAANAWNNSSAADLKDTDKRIIRSSVLKPFQVWRTTFTRIFMIFIGPIVLYFIILSFNFDIAWWLWGMLSIVFVLWLSVSIAVYAKYAKKRNQLLRHIPKEKRAGNYFAILLGYLFAVSINAALLIYVFLPFSKLSQEYAREWTFYFITGPGLYR